MISTRTVEEIKYKANIVEVVSKYVPLKKVGSELVANCPFHNEKSPSFKVSQSKGIYKCFGCGKSGDPINFVMEYVKVEYPEALKILADFYKISIENEVTEKKNYKVPALSKNELTITQIEWFNNRGINASTLQKLGVTRTNTWMPKAKKEIEAICFNYFRDGQLVNVKYRADFPEPKDFLLSKDSELIFYNLDAIKGSDYCIIVEGEPDCLAIVQAGILPVVSVPNGAGNGNLKLDYLDNCYSNFEDKKTIIIMTDNDEPGKRLRDELARRLGYERCFKVNYPDKCKDANDILLKYGALELLQVINNPIEFPIEGIIEGQQLNSEVYDLYRHGMPKGLKVGIPQFDEYISFRLGYYTTITGTPGAGKSEFTDFLITNIVKKVQWPVAICSFENQPSSVHTTKILEKYVGKAFAFREDINHRINENELSEGLNFINEYFYFINIDMVDVTLSGILEKAKELVMRKGVKILLIDPWNYIEHKRKGGQNETDYVSECLTMIKAFCKRFGVHTFLIAHPTKMTKVNGKYEVPTMYHISGSAHFFNKTDNGMSIDRDFNSSRVDVYINKIRDGWAGKTGMVSFNYDTELRQYTIAEPDNTQKEEKKKPPEIKHENPFVGMSNTTQSKLFIPGGFQEEPLNPIPDDYFKD